MYSLRRRLLASATLLLLVFLGVMGFGLNRAFERSVLSAAEDTLRNQILLLISAVEVIDGEIVAPQVLAEPRLLQPDSDMFAQVYAFSPDQTQTLIWRSPSLLDRTLPKQRGRLGDFKFVSSRAWQGITINTTTLAVEWETEGGMVPFVVQVAESNVVYQRRLARYQRQVGLWLAFFGGALVVLLLGILGWSLKPLERVRRQINEIEEGKRQRFDEDYPTEVSRLTQNLNQLLNFEEQRIERQKEVLGNLAHSLKTPIAVLKGLNYSEKLKSETSEQLAAMQTIIDYQLQSASAVGRRRFTKAIDVSESSRQVIRSLEKLHLDKGLAVTFNYQKGTVFYGDHGDWMEVLGNLCDNAFKWAASEVYVDIRQVDLGENASHKKPVVMTIQDDGPGIDKSRRDAVLQRGVRLDVQTPGHGLGMDIVKNIVDAYNGTIDIQEADLKTNKNDENNPASNSNKGTKFTVQLN